jgi:hypothetical protein
MSVILYVYDCAYLIGWLALGVFAKDEQPAELPPRSAP